MLSPSDIPAVWGLVQRFCCDLAEPLIPLDVQVQSKAKLSACGVTVVASLHPFTSRSTPMIWLDRAARCHRTLPHCSTHRFSLITMRLCLVDSQMRFVTEFGLAATDDTPMMGSGQATAPATATTPSSPAGSSTSSFKLPDMTNVAPARAPQASSRRLPVPPLQPSSDQPASPAAPSPTSPKAASPSPAPPQPPASPSSSRPAARTSGGGGSDEPRQSMAAFRRGSGQRNAWLLFRARECVRCLQPYSLNTLTFFCCELQKCLQARYTDPMAYRTACARVATSLTPSILYQASATRDSVPAAARLDKEEWMPCLGRERRTGDRFLIMFLIRFANDVFAGKSCCASTAGRYQLATGNHIR